MKPRFVGKLDFAPMVPEHLDQWYLEQPHAQVTKGGYLVISQPGKRINGASIPEFLWTLIGHPFEKDNKFWSPQHDQGYHGDAIVLRLKDFPDIAPESFLCSLGPGRYVYQEFTSEHVRKPRRWHDKVAWQGMGILHASLAKRIAVYSGVRAGGWASWNKRR